MMNSFKIHFVTWLLIIPMILPAQVPQTSESAGDTVKALIVQLEDIPALFLQTTIKLDQLAETLITENQLGNERTIIDSILTTINTLLIAEDSSEYDSLMSRTLVNKSNYWSRYREVLGKQVDKIEGIIADLTIKSKEVNRELRLWTRTKSTMDSVYTDSLYSFANNEVIVKADSLSRVILMRTKVAFSLLKRLNQSYVSVDKLLQQVNGIRRQRQEQLFEKTNRSFIRVWFNNPSNGSGRDYAKAFKDENVPILTHFYKTKQPKMILFLVYLFVLIGFFIFLTRKNSSLAKTKIPPIRTQLPQYCADQLAWQLFKTFSHQVYFLANARPY